MKTIDLIKLTGGVSLNGNNFLSFSKNVQQYSNDGGIYILT